MQAASTSPTVLNLEQTSHDNSGCKKKTGVMLAVIGLAHLLVGAGYTVAGLNEKNPEQRNFLAYYSLGLTAAALAYGATGIGLLWSGTRMGASGQQGTAAAVGRVLQLAQPVRPPEDRETAAARIARVLATPNTGDLTETLPDSVQSSRLSAGDMTLFDPPPRNSNSMAIDNPPSPTGTS